MIDELPLRMFGEDDQPTAGPSAVATPTLKVVAPEAPPPATAESAPLLCQMCGHASPADTELCPACGTRLRPLGAPAGEVAGGQSQPLECQWCDAVLPPGASVCPVCGSKAPDPALQLPGLNVTRPADELEFERPLYPALDDRYLFSNVGFGVAGALLRLFGGRRRW